MTFGSRQRDRSRPSPPAGDPRSDVIGSSPEPQVARVETPAESAALVISRALGADGAAEPRAPRRPRATVALAALLVAAGASGYIAGGSGSSRAKPREVEVGAIRLGLPQGWEPVKPSKGIETVAARPLVAAPPGDGERRIVAAELPRRGLGLLPAAAAARLEAVSAGESVALGDLHATRYRAVEARARGRPVTLFAAPTTRAVALVACAGPDARGGSFSRRCEGVAAMLSLAGSRTAADLAPGDVAAVDRAITVLDARRAAAGRALRGSRSRAARVRVVRALARAHAGAASALRRLRDGSEAARAGEPVVRSLRGVVRAYRRLAGASLGNSRRREQAARRGVRRRDALLRRAVERL